MRARNAIRTDSTASRTTSGRAVVVDIRDRGVLDQRGAHARLHEQHLPVETVEAPLGGSPPYMASALPSPRKIERRGPRS
jgi:hypothetical protein